MVTDRDAWIALLVLWASACVFALITTVRWLRVNWHHEFCSIVVWSFVATLPGLGLLLQVGYQLVQKYFFNVRPIPAYDLVMTPISCLWWLLGPLLLGLGVLARTLRDAPPGTTLVQGGHAVSWAISSFVSLEIAIAI